MSKMVRRKDLDEQFGFAGIALKKPLVKVTNSYYINIYELQSVSRGVFVIGLEIEDSVRFKFKNGLTERLLMNTEISEEELETFLKENLI